MRTQFVSARSNYDKKSGDSSGREVTTQAYYDMNKQFGGQSYILRIVDTDTRHKVADYGKQIASNNNVGYSQDDRYSLLEQLKKVKKPSKITKKCNCDCSSLVGAIMYLMGYTDFNKWTSTRTLQADFTRSMKKNGVAYKVIKFKSQDQLKKGDIINNESHHVVIVI